MSKFKNESANKMYDILYKLNYQRHLYSIRISFISMMPLMIISAYALVLNNLPILRYQSMMVNLFGSEWKNFGILIFNSTLQIAAPVLMFSICTNLSNWYSKNKKMTVHPNISAILATSVYMVLNININDPFISFTDLGVTGFFGAILISIIVTEIFTRLSNSHSSFIHVNYDPDIEVPMAFSAILPSILIIFGFALFRQILIFVGIETGLNDIMNYLLSLPYQTIVPNIKTTITYIISTHSMWLFGIHGTNVFESVATGFFENGLVNSVGCINTKTFLDVFVFMGGSGTTLGLIISLLLFSKNKANKTIFKYAIPNSILNINEPLIFGIPIVLNPVYAVPFILTPCIMFFTTLIAIKTGILPPIINEVSWSTPIIISGYAATGSLRGSFFQLFNLSLATLIYKPFVGISDKLSDMEFKSAYDHLVKIVAQNNLSEKQLLTRSDKVGSIARQLSNEMPMAMERGEMFLQYQPIINVREHRITDMEALLRWGHPKYGMINPMVTIAIAEENGFIDELGLWIFETAIKQRCLWTQVGVDKFKISINISTKQLDSPDLYKNVIHIIEKYQLQGSDINIEITESLALMEDDITYNNIRNLSNFGIGIVMDDFGVGHSSLIYIRNMPIDTIKIDGSLSRDIVNNEVSYNIVATIYDLSKLMDLNMVMEFVETEEQLDRIMGLGDFLIQGYFFSPPINGDEIHQLINDFKDLDLEKFGGSKDNKTRIKGGEIYGGE